MRPMGRGRIPRSLHVAVGFALIPSAMPITISQDLVYCPTNNWTIGLSVFIRGQFALRGLGGEPHFKLLGRQ